MLIWYQYDKWKWVLTYLLMLHTRIILIEACLVLTLIAYSRYSRVPNNRPGQSYLFSTFVPPRMPLLGTGRLLISGKYSRQDVYLGQDISKKCVLVLFFPACLFIYFLLKKSHFHLITDSECYELSAVHNVTFPKISVRTRVLSRNSWCFVVLTSCLFWNCMNFSPFFPFFDLFNKL